MPSHLVVYSSTALGTVLYLGQVLAEATLPSFLFLEPFHFDWVLQSPAIRRPRSTKPQLVRFGRLGSKVRLQTRYLQNPTPKSEQASQSRPSTCNSRRYTAFVHPHVRPSDQSQASIKAAVFRVTNTQPKQRSSSRPLLFLPRPSKTSTVQRRDLQIELRPNCHSPPAASRLLPCHCQCAADPLTIGSLTGFAKIPFIPGRTPPNIDTASRDTFGRELLPES